MCALISRRCGRTNDHRDSLKFVQEVARFVTSRFFRKKVARGVWKVTKSESKSWQHCTHLYYSPLSLSDCSSTRIFTLTGIFGPQPIRERGVRPSLSLIGLDPDMSLMCVCCWTTGRLFFSRTDRTQVRPQIFFCRTIAKLCRTLEPLPYSHFLRCTWYTHQNVILGYNCYCRVTEHFCCYWGVIWLRLWTG